MTAHDPEPLTYDSSRLIRQWRERYTGRRTVAHRMLVDAEVLVRDAIARELAQHDRQQKDERERELERREREVERAERQQQWRVDHLQGKLAEAELKLAKMSPRMTLMREERETVEDGTIVRLLAPTVPSYGDRTEPRPWMLGELEDVTHRLRMGGATEETELRFKRDAIEACVPFAEFALTPAPPARAPLLPDPVVSDVGSLRLDWRMPVGLVGLVLLVLSVVAGVVLL